MSDISNNIDVEKIDKSIELLNEYVKDTSIEPLLSALETLKHDPHNESLLLELSNTFRRLGIIQGAVLAYAPYLSVILSNDLFDHD